MTITPNSNSSGDDSGISDVPYSPYMTANTGFDPGYYQNAINTFFNNHQGPWTEYDTAYIMYLMQQYGGASTMVQANNQNEMNTYMSDIQQAWNDVYASRSPANSGSDDLTTDFITKLQDILSQMANDPFFKNNPQGAAMTAAISTNINAIINLIPSSGTSPSANQLFNLWVLYDPSIMGSTAQGDTSGMDGMMRQMGQLNQEFTGASQVVQANTQVEAKIWQTEQDTMNNFLKNLIKLLQVLQQAQKTYQ